MNVIWLFIRATLTRNRLTDVNDNPTTVWITWMNSIVLNIPWQSRIFLQKTKPTISSDSAKCSIIFGAFSELINLNVNPYQLNDLIEFIDVAFQRLLRCSMMSQFAQTMSQNANLIMNARKDGKEKTIDSRMHHRHREYGNCLVRKHEPIVEISGWDVQRRPHRVRQCILRADAQKWFHHCAGAASAGKHHERVAHVFAIIPDAMEFAGRWLVQTLSEIDLNAGRCIDFNLPVFVAVLCIENLHIYLSQESHTLALRPFQYYHFHDIIERCGGNVEAAHKLLQINSSFSAFTISMECKTKSENSKHYFHIVCYEENGHLQNQCAKQKHKMNQSHNNHVNDTQWWIRNRPVEYSRQLIQKQLALWASRCWRKFLLHLFLLATFFVIGRRESKIKKRSTAKPVTELNTLSKWLHQFIAANKAIYEVDNGVALISWMHVIMSLRTRRSKCVTK